MNSKGNLFFALCLAVLLAACNRTDVLYDLSEESHPLLKTDSSSIEFPQYYAGNYTIISFIFTNCHDVCPVITANMKNIQNAIKDTSNVRFVEISFDPERDTPSVLKEYKDLYRLNKKFTLLTGDPAKVRTLLDRLDIHAEKSQPVHQQSDSSQYMMTHSNTIYLMDPAGRILFEYPASVTPPEHVAEDLQSLR